MARYKSCEHYDGKCPCLECAKWKSCYGCTAYVDRVYVVDTDKLCVQAKAYCESGQEGAENEKSL